MGGYSEMLNEPLLGKAAIRCTRTCDKQEKKKLMAVSRDNMKYKR